MNLDKQKLPILSDILKRGVDDKEIVGGSLLVIKDGEEYYYADAGYADYEAGKKISRDTIFRIYSQSKPVTGFASTQMIDRGIICPRTPLYEYLPGFKNQVYGDDCKPVGLRPVYLADCLNMTSGISYPNGNGPLAARESEKRVAELRKKQDEGKKVTTNEFINSLGSCPLSFMPGTRWEYGYSADVMGAVLEVATGKTFGELLKEEIFEPLNMKDTGFVLSEEKRDRLAQTYCIKNGEISRFGYWADRNLGLNAYKAETSFESGGAGLVSTIDDYAQFAKMLQARGTYNNHRFISEYGYRYYHAPQLTESQAKGFNWQDCDGHNYGNFVMMVKDGAPSSFFANKGTYGWGGWLGTNFFVDPVEKLSLLYMTQRGDCTNTTSMFYKLRSALYGCLD